MVLGFVIGFFMGELGVGEKAGIVGALAGLALGFGYFTYYFGSSGQTWGKRICGLRVVRVDGGRLGYGESLRAASWATISLFFCWGIGFLMVGFTRRSQGLHDKLVGSCVIRVR